MAIVDVVTIGGGVLEDAGFLARDCAFPVTRLQMRLGNDEVLRNMPVNMGYWEDDSIAPVELSQSIDIDTSDVVGECDVAVVTAALTEGELIAPNQTKVKLKTPTLVIDKLRKAFCRQRNISTRELGLVLNAGGGLDLGNPYAIDFGRFALASVTKALAQIVTEYSLRGDESMPFGFDGLYTQLENGWTQGTAGVPQYLNQAITFDWPTLTGETAPTPDSLTEAGHTISLWGEDYDVPEGINLIQLFEDYLFSPIDRQWADAMGGVDVWEMHVPFGSKRCYQNASACMQPCGGDGGIWDTELRARFANMRRGDVVEFYPSGRQVPMWETSKIENNEMWIGPRSIGGFPTYALIFRDLDTMFSEQGILGSTYGQGSGAFPDVEPLLTETIDTLPFEARTVHYDVEKISMDCVEAGLMTIVGMLVVARHLWIHVTGVNCGTMLQTVLSGVTIDGDPIEGAPAITLMTSPANNATGFSTTGNLVATANALADTYDFQIATDANFNTIVQVANQASNTYTIAPAVAAATAHWWRVRSRNENGAGAWSATRKFTTA